jgi:hypothetical protein
MTGTEMHAGRIEKFGPIQTRVSVGPSETASDSDAIDSVLDRKFGKGPIANQRYEMSGKGPFANKVRIIQTAWNTGAAPVSPAPATMQTCEEICGFGCLETAPTLVGYVICVAACDLACHVIAPELN